MYIRKAEEKDFSRIMEIYAYAQDQMIANGNPTQWAHEYPEEWRIHEDIEIGRSYLVCDDSRKTNDASDWICGVFALVVGDDETYRHIDGAWLNEELYGAVHRIAAGEGEKGVLKEVLDWAENEVGNIRIDTHADNSIMHHLLKKYGYKHCGTIYTYDGSPRTAYQKIR